jgi:hypothetical protein
MMVEDSLTVLTEEKAILNATMNQEAKARGHVDWIAAYHADWLNKLDAGFVLALYPEPKDRAPADAELAEARVAVAQLLELRTGEMSAKEEQLLGVILERVK